MVGMSVQREADEDGKISREGVSGHGGEGDIKDFGTGNLGWAYMELKEYTAAEAVYRKAQVVEPDANKACNLCTCLIKQGKVDEARLKVRVQELLSDLDVVTSVSVECEVGMDEIAVVEGIDEINWLVDDSPLLWSFE
ncbi:unnamed protein product [Brassica oleracea]